VGVRYWLRIQEPSSQRDGILKRVPRWRIRICSLGGLLRKIMTPQRNKVGAFQLVNFSHLIFVE